MTIALSVNLDKIALIRNSRFGDLPNVSNFAKSALNYGASGITVHPRPDCRHILEQDVYQLALIKNAHLNIEGNPLAASRKNYSGYLEIVAKARPWQCTLVPDDDNQLTSDHGWDLESNASILRPYIKKLKAYGCQVSLFVNAQDCDYSIAKQIGADRVELYTEELAKAYNTDLWEQVWQKYYQASLEIHKAGLGLNAGHDLSLENLSAISKLPYLQEVSIGHALVIDALHYGWPQAIHRYLDLLS